MQQFIRVCFYAIFQNIPRQRPSIILTNNKLCDFSRCFCKSFAIETYHSKWFFNIDFPFTMFISMLINTLCLFFSFYHYLNKVLPENIHKSYIIIVSSQRFFIHLIRLSIGIFSSFALLITSFANSSVSFNKGLLYFCASPPFASLKLILNS